MASDDAITCGMSGIDKHHRRSERSLFDECYGLMRKYSAVRGPEKGWTGVAKGLRSLIPLLEGVENQSHRPDIATALEACHRLFKDLDELLDLIPVSTFANTHDVQPNTFLGTIVKHTPRKVFNVRNSLALNLHLKLNDDAVKNRAQLHGLKESLDKMTDELLTTYNSALSYPCHYDGHTSFTVEEYKSWEDRDNPSTWMRSTASKLVCPNGSFLHDISAGSEVLKFACLCMHKGESHDEQLEYRLLPDTDCFEKLNPDSGPAWLIGPIKPRTGECVQVKISGLSWKNYERMKHLANTLANWILGLVPSGKLSVPRLLSAGATCTIEPGRFAELIQIETTFASHALPWRLREMLWHDHTCAHSPPISAHYEFEQPGNLPRDYFRLFLNFESLKSNRMQVYLHRYSTIEQQRSGLEALFVVLDGIGIVEDRKAHLNNCKMKLRFKTADAKAGAKAMYESSDAATTSSTISTLAPDNERRTSDELDPSSTTSGTTIIKLIETKRKDDSKSQFRLIMSKKIDGIVSISLCIDFADQLLRIAHQGLQTSMNTLGFFETGYDKSSGPIVVQTNWTKIRNRLKYVESAARNHSPYVGGAQLARDETPSSDDWFDLLDDLKSAMDPPRAATAFQRVKVCVIDTGFNPNDKDVAKVKVYKDFVEPFSGTKCDDTWHGTISATIILSIYEECELYVARVFRTNEADENTGPELMARAIEWAIEPEQDVDVISISAGFEKHSPRLQQAVQRANSANKLIFAAASNWGNAGPVAFPARHDLYTLCIFSTDTSLKDSSFNPDPRPNSNNFAILGEDYGHPQNPRKRVRGTSMATAAAAGLAALIIDFSRHPDNQGIVRVADVSKMVGMIAIFNAMAIKAGEFKCIKPTTLLPSNYYSLRLDERRRYIRESVSRAMDKAN
ncbi:hypothetical protein HIM_02315 [Hirsutella minnesotensis 3608]|nr:hypothetical protein HIM_02315 [Hirsutella minnesotensis 3608]